MTIFDSLQDYSPTLLLIFVVVYFVAGFIDAVVGGGGLLTVPTLIVALPTQPLATLFGTNKIAALSGGIVAARQYARRIRFDFRLLAAVAIVAFAASFAGAKIVSKLDSQLLKPFMLLILIAIAIYTFFKKDLGLVASKDLSFGKQLFFGLLLGLVVGFYDGFFGPGTGSFFVLGFVAVLGFDFLKASAYSKVVNCVTNIGALTVFVSQGNYILGLALIMAVANMCGNAVGTRMALTRGNGFVRKLFLVVLVLLILRYGYDVFLK